eukprot:scaffold48758_cov61-Phaeocystis_antarctica.AAC.3
MHEACARRVRHAACGMRHAACGMRHARGYACVVDEHVAAAVPGHERLGKGIRARSVAHLQRHVLGAPTDLRRRMLAARRVAAAQHDHAEEAAVHEALRDVVADSLVGAGHHGDASGDHLSVAILDYAPSRHSKGQYEDTDLRARCWQGPAATSRCLAH